MKRLLGVLLAFATVIAFNMTALAVGIGGYVDVDPVGGSVKSKVGGSQGYTHNGTSKVLAVGGGFVFDTNVLGSSVFNYRMKLGGEKIWGDKDTEFDGQSGHWSHTFGFRLYSNDKVRLWLGPTFGFRYMTGKYSDMTFGQESIGWRTEIALIQLRSAFGGIYLEDLVGSIGIHDIRANYTFFGFDSGLIFGMNFGLTDFLVLSGEVGGKYLLFSGNATRKITTLYQLGDAGFYQMLDFRKEKQKLTAHQWDVTISMSVLFRVGETTSRRRGRRR